MIRRAPPALLALAALLVLLPGTAAAQQLSEFTKQLTLAWARGDAGDIAALIADRGVSMNVAGEAAGPLQTRHASALLRRVFSDVETISVTLSSKKMQAGEPARAYLELRWVRRARGTTIPGHATVFVAVVEEDESWRITEIRLLQ